MKICSSCGYKQSDNNEFCTNCGKVLEGSIKQQVKIFETSKLIILVIVIVVLVLTIIYLLKEIRNFEQTRKDIQDYKYNKSVNEYFSQPTTYDLKIEDGWTSEIKGNYIYINGSVKNISDKTISYFKISSIFLDSGGNVVDSDWTNDGEEINPGESRKFEMMTKYNESFKSIKLEIKEVN